jgi:phosphohistidine phosphatase
MDLYLIRHADALPVGEGGANEDMERPLSKEGEIQTRELAGFLQRKGIHLDKLVTSPLVRAQQTAQGILASWTGTPPELVLCKELRPGGKRGKLARFLLKLEGDALALIGHQPDLGALAGWLIGSKRTQIEIAKAGFAWITCSEIPRKASGSLQWLVTPQVFGPGSDATVSKAVARIS